MERPDVLTISPRGELRLNDKPILDLSEIQHHRPAGASLYQLPGARVLVWLDYGNYDRYVVVHYRRGTATLLPHPSGYTSPADLDTLEVQYPISQGDGTGRFIVDVNRTIWMAGGRHFKPGTGPVHRGTR